MPGLAVAASGSPFKKTRRAEYRYGPVSVEAEEPIAPLIDPSLYDNRALILVPDIYATWPQVGALPRAASYHELTRMLEAYMERSCSRRLPPGLCSRVEYRAVPSAGEAGGWRYTARPGDTLLYSLLHAARIAEAGRLTRVYLLAAEEQHPPHTLAAHTAALLAAALAGAEYVELHQEPQPYPRRGTPLIDTLEAYTLPSESAARILEALAPEEPPEQLLAPRGPAKPPRLRRIREARRLVNTLNHVRRCMLLPLIHEACSGSPASRLAGVLAEAAEAYASASRLAKKRGGGTVAHGLEASAGALHALAAGAALQALAARLVEPSRGEACREEGVPRTVVEKLAKLLGCPGDETPRTCVEERDERLRLRQGCLRTLLAA